MYARVMVFIVVKNSSLFYHTLFSTNYYQLLAIALYYISFGTKRYFMLSKIDGIYVKYN